MKILNKSSRVFLVALLLLISLPSYARYNAGFAMVVKNCDLDIKADQVAHSGNRISYSGNVRFLYRFASVKVDSITLIKNKDGSCQIVANPNGEKPFS